VEQEGKVLKGVVLMKYIKIMDLNKKK